jgi:hypothetical protein
MLLSYPAAAVGAFLLLSFSSSSDTRLARSGIELETAMRIDFESQTYAVCPPMELNGKERERRRWR